MKRVMEQREGRTWGRFVLPLLVLVLSLWWGNVAFAEETVELHYGGGLDYDMANEIVNIVNQERSAAGLSTLTQTGDLQNLAMIRAMESALYFSHTRPDGTRGLDIMGTSGTRAENISVGFTSAASAMNGWMNSPGHRANILNDSVSQIGVGCFYANGAWYGVQLFRSGSGGSGSVLSGYANKAIAVKARPSVLELYVQESSTSFSADAVVKLTAGGAGKGVVVLNRNTAIASRRFLTLYASSPGLTWKSDGSFTIGICSSVVGATLYGQKCGSSQTLTLTCGTRSFATQVSIAHNPEAGTNCEKDIKCTVCRQVLEAKSGHSGSVSCTEYTACTKCGKSIPPAGHQPASAATCTKDSRCKVCGVVLTKAYGHNYAGASCRSEGTCTRCGQRSYSYGDHVMGAWTYSSDKSYRTRKCTVCGYSEREQLVKPTVKVSSVKIKGKTSVAPGKKITLTASVSPSNAANKAVTWSSSNTKYATVSSKGVVTAKAAGAGKTVTITAKAKDGSGKKATFKVKITKAVKVKALKIKGKTSVLAGKKITLKASVSPSNASNKAVTWSSGNKKYATVSSKGVVTAKAAGAGKTVTITARAKDGSGKKATFKVKIKGAVSKITLKGSKTLKAGKKTTIKATVKVGKGGSKALQWSSSNKKYATVSSKGVVTAKAAGKGKTVAITAKAKDGSGKKATIKIKIK
ncbi:MAG TPA: Ig-like domain-containing protein [Candidatus Choladousia intestinigallinarum]|nr:Ig-like domain-containing protein [Candidatus Choladousia intestinigallinarum]